MTRIFFGTLAMLYKQGISFPFLKSLCCVVVVKFSIPKHASSIEIKPSFEKVNWILNPHIPEDLRDIAASTLGFVAVNYIHRKGPKPHRTLLKAIRQLKKRDDIVRGFNRN